MNILVWVIQVLLALAFLAHGLLFLAPSPDVAVQMNAALPRWFSFSLGIAEVAAACGLILPAATRILPWLTTWAAVGIMLVTASATVYHVNRGEMSSAGVTVALLVLATLVAYMRGRVLRIRPRRAPREAHA